MKKIVCIIICFTTTFVLATAADMLSVHPDSLSLHTMTGDEIRATKLQQNHKIFLLEMGIKQQPIQLREWFHYSM